MYNDFGMSKMVQRHCLVITTLSKTKLLSFTQTTPPQSALRSPSNASKGYCKARENVNEFHVGFQIG